MTRRAEQIPLEDDWVLTKVWSKRQSAPAILAAIQAVPKDAAFTPALSAGEAFDSAEVVPPAASEWCNAPPNCGLPPSEIAHSGQEPTQAGQVLAHAQHEAAISGAECNGTACLMTRGSD